MYPLIHSPTFDIPLNMGPYIPNVSYQQPVIGASNVLPLTTPQGSNNYRSSWSQPERTYALGVP